MNKNLTGMVDRLIETTIEEQFAYEPSEIIRALFESGTIHSRKRSFKKRKEEPTAFRLFTENTYYIRKG